jgi:hypothetical protein
MTPGSQSCSRGGSLQSSATGSLLGSSEGSNRSRILILSSLPTVFTISRLIQLTHCGWFTYARQSNGTWSATIGTRPTVARLVSVTPIWNKRQTFIVSRCCHRQSLSEVPILSKRHQPIEMCSLPPAAELRALYLSCPETIALLLGSSPHWNWSPGVAQTGNSWHRTFQYRPFGWPTSVDRIRHVWRRAIYGWKLLCERKQVLHGGIHQ